MNFKWSISQFTRQTRMFFLKSVSTFPQRDFISHEHPRASRRKVVVNETMETVQ